MNCPKNLKKSRNIEGHLIYKLCKLGIYRTENVVAVIFFLDLYNKDESLRPIPFKRACLSSSAERIFL